MNGTYSRWTRVSGTERYVADILGSDVEIVANADDATISAVVPQRRLSPDEARMIGVRLIEAACIAGEDVEVRVIAEQ